MNKLTITTYRFLDWYFESGCDTEIVETKFDLAQKVIEKMYNVGQATISVQELFDECDKDTITLNFTEQGSESDYDVELQGLGEYEIKLI